MHSFFMNEKGLQYERGDLFKYLALGTLGALGLCSLVQWEMIAVSLTDSWNPVEQVRYVKELGKDSDLPMLDGWIKANNLYEESLR